MKHKIQLLIFLALSLTTTTAKADKGDAFIVGGAWGRFYGDALAYWRQGVQQVQRGNLNRARSAFDAAIRADKNCWPAYINRAEVSLQLGQIKAALQDCNAASRLRPDFYRTFTCRAEVYRRLGQCQEALTDLNRVLSFHRYPEVNAIALSERALLRLSCRDRSIHDPKLALADAQQACALVGWTKANFMGVLAIAYAENGDFQKAIQSEERATNSGRYTDAELQLAKERLARYKQHHQS